MRGLDNAAWKSLLALPVWITRFGFGLLDAADLLLLDVSRKAAAPEAFFSETACVVIEGVSSKACLEEPDEGKIGVLMVLPDVLTEMSSLFIIGGGSGGVACVAVLADRRGCRRVMLKSLLVLATLGDVSSSLDSSIWGA